MWVNLETCSILVCIVGSYKQLLAYKDERFLATYSLIV